MALGLQGLHRLSRWLPCRRSRISRKEKAEPKIATPQHVGKRPIELEADVVRFQNNKEKWIAFVGLIDGRPYEIFTGLADDDDGIFCPKSVTHGKLSKPLTTRATSAMISNS